MQVNMPARTRPSDRLSSQTRELHELLTGLLRCTHLFDRNSCSCYGLSVSQCQALGAIALEGEISMNELASRMWLTPSTMTRIVDQLARKGLIQRCYVPGDRRVCCVRLTTAGESLYARVREDLLARERAILEALQPGERIDLLKALGSLKTQAERVIQECCRSGPGSVPRPAGTENSSSSQ